MSEQDLFQQGVAAIREDNDLAKGRNLLTQALRLDPANDMAWVWLSRTVSASEKKKECIERALKINPNNEQARKLLERLGADSFTGSNATQTPVQETGARAPIASAPGKSVSSDDAQQIKVLLAKAQSFLEKEQIDNAIEQWVRVLEIDYDHEVALGNAVRYLSRQKFMDDAKELVWNALEKGSTHPSVYLTAIAIARREDDQDKIVELRERLISLPDATEEMIVEHSDKLLESHHFQQALSGLEKATENHPKSQKILLRAGNVLEEMDRGKEAIPYFERAAKLGVKTLEGKEAEGKLDAFAPALTDRERGNTLLAVREAFGIGIFVLLMGWLDAGLNFLQMNAGHWIGALLGLVGGYLVITATSSPQQQPLARLLGGKPPEAGEPEKDEFGNVVFREVSQLPIIPPIVRSVLGIVGVVVVGLAVYMVFTRTIQLLGNPNPPTYYIPSYSELLAEVTK